MLKGSHTYQSCHLKNDPYQTCETSGKGYKPATTKPNSALRLPKFSWPMTNSTPEDGKHAKTRVQLPHSFHLGWSLSEGVFSNHSTKRARVAPVKLVRHIGHWRSCPPWWHFLHTECPHGTRATRCLFSWQMGHWPLMPCGESFASLAMLQAACMVTMLPSVK